ncbi:hypothetical protein A1O1_09224 [Capronia coronata CBS 617.96]|uniref:Uncharacterized protein n=1 Tax=Capronia coronata CBS 617.96 TaxID=1182541 RepID=W9XED3_9EURO|nr:uncharacterized protein A1O1_09224 [Capronia coronata CBS 617.96]EXJ78822.1 hypothetical protein A1O1_09224 [Capronia coronata CBS 617.96]
MVDIARRRVISASPSSPAFKNSPPFKELGCFDEESCRYFLREVGSRVVPFYPFNFGMEEVYSLILERFGYPGIPDATSLLQELLEKEDVAGGFGDDGDIWRSWRHSWRHRNDDSLNPFIPKIGNFVLQAPTEPHIRRIKAQNFILQCEEASAQAEKAALAATSGTEDQAQSPEAGISQPVEIDDAEDEYTLPATTFSHQRTRTLLASGVPLTLDVFGRAERPSSRRTSTSSEASSQQEFIEVDRSNLDPDVDPSLLVSFEMLTNDPSSPTGYGPSLRGGQAEVITLQQVRSPTTPTTTDEHDDTDDTDDQVSPSVGDPGPAVLATPEAETANVEPPSSDIATPERAAADVTTVENEVPASLDQDESADDEPESAEHARPSGRANKGQQLTLSMRTRAMNREFRLIDGTIFHPGARKRVSSHSSPGQVGTGNVESRRASIVRRSWTPVLQKIESRQSWLRNTASSVLTLFRRNSQDKKAKQSSRNLKTTNSAQAAAQQHSAPSTVHTTVTKPSTTEPATPHSSNSHTSTTPPSISHLPTTAAAAEDSSSMPEQRRPANAFGLDGVLEPAESVVQRSDLSISIPSTNPPSTVRQTASSHSSTQQTAPNSQLRTTYRHPAYLFGLDGASDSVEASNHCSAFSSSSSSTSHSSITQSHSTAPTSSHSFVGETLTNTQLKYTQRDRACVPESTVPLHLSLRS